MSKRGNIKTSRKQIIEYWETCQDECELSVDGLKQKKDVGDVGVKQIENWIDAILYHMH